MSSPRRVICCAAEHAASSATQDDPRSTSGLVGVDSSYGIEDFIDWQRLEIDGVSIPIVEIIGAMFSSASQVVGATVNKHWRVILPSYWGTPRTATIGTAIATLHHGKTIYIPAARVISEALPSSSAKWPVVIELAATGACVSLVERGEAVVEIRATRRVSRVHAHEDSYADTYVSRIVDVATTLRSQVPAATTGSSEFLVSGDGSEQVIAALDDRRQVSYHVDHYSRVRAGLWSKVDSGHLSHHFIP